VRGAGVLRDVRQGLGDDVVGRRLDRQGQPLVERVAVRDARVAIPNAGTAFTAELGV